MMLDAKKKKQQWYLRCQQMLFIYVIFFFHYNSQRRRKKIIAHKKIHANASTVAVFRWICVILHICDSHFAFGTHVHSCRKQEQHHCRRHRRRRRCLSNELLTFLSIACTFTHIHTHYASLSIALLMLKLTHILSLISDAKQRFAPLHRHIESLPYFFP